METLILKQLLQMNLIGIYGILLAFAVRLLLRKVGSWYCYAMWIIVFLNLALPTILTGSFSLIPKQLYQVGLAQDAEPIYDADSGNALAGDVSEQVGTDADYFSSLSGTDYYDLRNGAVDEVVDVTLEADLDAESGTTPDTVGLFGKAGLLAVLKQAWSRVASVFGGETILVRCLLVVWVSVMLILFAMEGVQYQKTRRRLGSLKRTGTDEENHAVTLEGLETPLLFGFLRPTIYLPDHLKEEERAYILRHELYHRRRKDYIVKALALSISIVYWYNPLVWAAFHCFGVDMELSCDEAVLLHADTDIRKAYAGSLLKYGALQNHYVLTSLTFGEPGLKARVKHVLQFQKRGVIITAVAVLAVVLLAVGLLVRPTVEGESTEGGPTMDEADLTQETYGWSIEEESIIHNDAVVYEITDAYSYGEITGNFVSEDSAYMAYHLEDAGICVLSTHDAGVSWQQTYIGEADEMDALGALYLSFLENGTGYLLYTSSPAAGLMTKILYISADEGASFHMVGDITDSVQNYPQWMVFYDENMGMILTQYHGYEAYAYLTTDGGVTWEALDLDVPDAEGSSYIDGISLIQTNKEMNLWVMHLQAVFDDRVDIYLDSMGGWTAFTENETATQTQTESKDEDIAVDSLAHTAEQVLQFADVLYELDEEDYCQILTIHGYSILLVAKGTYDTSWARGSEHGTIGAEVYFPGTEMDIYSMGTAYPLQYNTEGIYVEWNTGTYTIYTLEEESGKLLTEERELNEGEWDTLYDIPFVTKEELLAEAGISEEELESAAHHVSENEADLAQKEALEQALLKADGETLTMETLLELVDGGLSSLTGFDYANCENAVLNYTEGTGVLSYCYEFMLEYEGVAYTFRANYYKDDNSLYMLYISDDAGTADLFCICRVNEFGNDYTASPEDFESYLRKTADMSDWTLEMFITSVTLPDEYTLGAWDTTIDYLTDSSAAMSGGVLIEPVAYALQEGYERYSLIADWQYYSGFFAVISEGFWSWENDTLVPGTFPRENHMSSEIVEMVDGTAKTAYLVEVVYDLYTAAGQTVLQNDGVDLDKIDTVSKYWYIIFVDDGAGATTGYCLGLAQNQFTKEEAIAIAQSVVFAE